MKSYEEMVSLFENANSILLTNDLDLFESSVSERTLCGALMLHLHDLIADKPSYQGYFTDVEYNEYFPKLKEMLFNLVSEIESNGAEKQIVDATRDYVEKITRSNMLLIY